MRSRLGLTVWVLTGSLTVSSASMAEEPRPRAVVGPGVEARIAERGSARVVVTFELSAEATETSAPSQTETSPARMQADQILDRVAPLAVHRRFARVRAFVVTIGPAGLARLRAEPDVLRIDIERGFELHLNESRAVTETDAVHRWGYRGSGITVAVIDSGYDSDHPDLTAGLVAEQCYCTGGCCPNGEDEQSGAGAAEDDHRHGTHVTGIIASDGVEAPKGYAPDADVVAVKVLDDQNFSCCLSDLVAALDWIAAERPDVDVINASLGSFALFGGDCDRENATNQALAQAIGTLRSRGVLLVTSTGNQADPDNMASPACIADAISVGATYDASVGTYRFGCTDDVTAADDVCCFSNASPTLDLLAPGAPIVSSRRGGGTLSFGGTSMASPAVAGCAALILEAKPGISAIDLEQALESSTATVVDQRTQRVHPRLDCREALIAAAPDRDGDGHLDFDDLCPDAADPANADSDGDGRGDACETCPLDPDNDVDDDGVCGDVDNCPRRRNGDQRDTDTDARGDACDVCPLDPNDDEDGDGRCAEVDNCPLAANPDQSDGDGDGRGDLCDPCPSDPENDADGDGVCESVDNCPAAANAEGSDADEDGRGDVCDPCPFDPQDDADGDGRCADLDNCPTVANADGGDLDGDGRGDACDPCPRDALDDADRDAVCADLDNCATTPNPTQTDRDDDGLGDECDPCPDDVANDADGDGRCESTDPCPADPDPACRPEGEGCACVTTAGFSPFWLALGLLLGAAGAARRGARPREEARAPKSRDPRVARASRR